jgi:hypothetical protein
LDRKRYLAMMATTAMFVPAMRKRKMAATTWNSLKKRKMLTPTLIALIFRVSKNARFAKEQNDSQ